MLGYEFDTKQTCAALSISMESSIALAQIAPNSVYTCSISVATVQILCTLINVCGCKKIKNSSIIQPSNSFSLRNKQGNVIDFFMN